MTAKPPRLGRCSGTGSCTTAPPAATAIDREDRSASKIDALCCPCCDGRMRHVATIKDKTVIDTILTHLGLPTAPPPIVPARAPPQPPLLDPRVS